VERKVIAGILALGGILALSTTPALAGAGGTPSPLTSFFVCRGINSDDPNAVVDIQSPIFGNRLSVRIGNGTLACAFAKLFRAGTTEEISPNPLLTHEELKCYSLVVPKKATAGTPPPQFTITDELAGAEPGVQATDIRYICAPASLTQ